MRRLDEGGAARRPPLPWQRQRNAPDATSLSCPGARSRTAAPVTHRGHTDAATAINATYAARARFRDEAAASARCVPKDKSPRV